MLGPGSIVKYQNKSEPETYQLAQWYCMTAVRRVRVLFASRYSCKDIE
jgi:hypothetical protein